MLTRKEIFYLVLLGVTAGFFLTFYPAGLFVLFLFLFSLFLIKITVKTESSNFLIKLFIISFILRALLCIVNYNVGLSHPFWGGDTQPDATVYSGNAFYIAHLLKKDAIEENFAMAKDPYLVKRVEIERNYYENKLPAVDEYQFGKYVFSLGIFYAWLGYAPIAAKMMNSLFSCISIIVVYLISRQLFEEEKPARIAAIIFAFFPSIFYWSVTALRDAPCNLFILAYLLCLVKFITEKKLKYIFWLFPFIYFINSLRPQFLMVTLAGVGIALFLVYFKNLRFRGKSIPKVFFLLGIYLALFILLLHGGAIFSKIVSIVNSLAKINIQFAAITDYRIYSDLVYQQGRLNINDIFSLGFLATVFKAVIYFFFAPFPLGDWTLNFLPFYPQIIYWYLMFPFVIKGWLLFLKKDIYTTFILAVLLLILIIPIALHESNIGTAFRHKDMFMPIAFVFAAYAFTERKVSSNRHLSK